MKISRTEIVPHLRAAAGCASGRGALALVLLGAVIASVAASSGAQAAVDVGELFVPQHSCSANTFLQTGVAEGNNSYTVPTYGAITSWSFYTAGEAVPGLTLKVARPDGGGLFTIVGEAGLPKEAKQLTNQVNTYPADILVEPGEVIGLYTSGTINEQNCGTATSIAGDSYMYALGNWGDGTTALFQTPQPGKKDPEREPPYGLFPVQALVSGPPISALPIPACSAGSFPGMVAADYGTVPKALHYTVDGGPEGTAKANSATGEATIKGVPIGYHTLEWWGEDKAGDPEFTHHTATVFVTKEKPHLAMTSEQNKSVYNEGERGSMSIRASSPHGLVVDPSTSRVPIETPHAGFYQVPATATDNCGNTASESFQYTVSAIDRHLRLSHTTFSIHHSGRHPAGTEIEYTTDDEGATNFTVIKGVTGYQRGRRCVAAHKRSPKGHPCTHFGEDVVGEFTHMGETGANVFHFDGRIGGRDLKPGTYRLTATPTIGGITGRTISATFTVAR